jgi:hypothetical protein
VSDPTKKVLEHTNTTRCGQLRRQWLSNPPLSNLAQMIDHHQQNCSIPLATHHFDNTFGLGSHLLLWGQAMCNAMESNLRMRSFGKEWLWLDQKHCDMEQANQQSPMLCYFPKSEYRCPHKEEEAIAISIPTTTPSSLLLDNHQQKNVSDPRNTKEWCQLVQEASPDKKAEYRAAATEYLFQRVSPLVIQEAKRQMGILFSATNGVAPKDLITLHIRWGDKFWEMDLPSIEEYMDAVKRLLLSSEEEDTNDNNQNATTTTTANIYLATEDPRAYQEFMAAIPPGWKVYPDITLLEINAFRPPKGNRASWATRNTKGRAGLVAMGSLLVAMEANLFVLTTKSNWSTMMNHLRTNVVDPRCGNCTRAMDLRPNVW